VSAGGPVRFDIPLDDGASLGALHWRHPGAPAIAFSHGAGLAVGGYRDFLQLLADRYDLIAFDLRGHGLSAGARLPGTGVLEVLTEDMEAVWTAVRGRTGGAPAAGVFHSISGVLAIRQVVARGPRWAALALLDPPLTPPEGHALMPVKRNGTEIMVRRVTNRRDRFPSVEAFAAELAGRAEFARWRDGAHRLLAEATLMPDPEDGDWTLSVPPAREAQIYRENVLPELGARLADIATPIRFICSDPDGPHASPIPRLCSAVAGEAGVAMEIVRGTTHMLPLEEPEACADAVTAFLTQNGFPPAA
jgi:pimeloyl-ACP methyl ester carboxylesterase